jgi:soluble epoxide hydrolase/lipid-phosphate phosphatase
MAGLLDHLEIPTVTVIGHDWGGLVTWRFGQFYPERVKALASFCTPYIPPSQQDVTLEQIVQVLPNFKYQLYLSAPEAEKDMNENVGKFFRLLFRPIAEGKRLIDPETNTLAEGREDLPRHETVPEKVMDYYVEWYTKQGARGGLNWYKQTHNNYVQCKDLDPIIRKPSMMVIAELDKALPPSMAEKMPEYIPGLELHLVTGSGHWILWEKPEECNQFLKGFLAKVDPINTNKL